MYILLNLLCNIVGKKDIESIYKMYRKVSVYIYKMYM